MFCTMDRHCESRRTFVDIGILGCDAVGMPKFRPCKWRQCVPSPQGVATQKTNIDVIPTSILTHFTRFILLLEKKIQEFI
jgi:hypothetical protein